MINFVMNDNDRLCSGNEYTNTFGAHTMDGNLTPFIHHCFKPFVKKCILDGEMIGYDPATKTFGMYDFVLIFLFS